MFFIISLSLFLYFFWYRSRLHTNILCHNPPIYIYKQILLGTQNKPTFSNSNNANEQSLGTTSHYSKHFVRLRLYNMKRLICACLVNKLELTSYFDRPKCQSLMRASHVYIPRGCIARTSQRERKRRYFVEFTSGRIFNAVAGRSISRKQQHQQIEGVLTQQGADSVGDVSEQIKRSAACEKFFSFSDTLTTKGLELLPPFKNLPRA